MKILRKADEHEFLPLLAEIEDEPASPLGRIILKLLLALFLLAVIGLFVAKIDVVVSGRGIIIPEGEIKMVQPLEGGVIRSINVRVGDMVKAGDVLMEIDPSAIDPDYQSKRENLEEISAEIKCITELLEERECGVAKYLSARNNMLKQIDVKRAQISQIREETKSAELQLATAKDLLKSEEERFNNLGKVRDIISQDEYIRSRDTLQTLKRDIGNYEHTTASLKHQITQLENEIDVVRGGTTESWQKELSDLKKTYTSLKAEVDQTAFRHEKQQIISPVDGFINIIYVHTVGGVVTPAQELFSIVPSTNTLLAKVQILNKDIGYITVGQESVLKIDTFDFQKYGKINGKVRHISPDSIDNEQLGRVYEVYIEPDNLTLMVDGKLSPITSGMSMTAEVKVGKRRVIEFFIYPAIKYLDEGMSVR
jgi:hemolysin D